MRAVKQISVIGDKSFNNSLKDTLETLIKQNTDYNFAKLEVYVNNNLSDQYEYLEVHTSVKKLLKEIFKSKIPAFTVHFLDFCDEVDFRIQVELFKKSECDVLYKTILKHPYVVVKSEYCTEVISGDISFKENSLLFSSQRCFDFAEQILMAEDMNFGNIYRQWNYIPDLNGTSDYESSQRGNLHIFNEIKGFFFEENLFINGKPIISNINNSSNTLVIDFNAIIQNNPDTELSILKGKIDELNFLDCKLIETKNKQLWFKTNENILSISDDIEQQTIEIFKNIIELNKSVNDNSKENSDAIKYIKATIKNKNDFNSIKQIINEILPNTPIIINYTDSLRNNLLIEIEGLLSD